MVIKMTATIVYSENFSEKSVSFRERDNCISCGSLNLSPQWISKFNNEPTRSFIEKCHYSEDVIKLLGEETFSLVRCEDCGMTFHRRILTPQWLNLLYSQWINNAQIEHMEAEYYTSKQEVLFSHGRQGTKHLLRLQKLLKVNATKNLSILDYGCGDGYFLNLAKLFGFDTYGIDFSTVRNERAASRGMTIFNNLEALKSDGIGKMNAVTLFQVLEHLEDPLNTLKNIANVMLDGGILIVEVPDYRGVSQPKNFRDFHNVHPLEHINAFTPISLKRMCEQAGFVAIKRTPTHVTTSVVDLLRTEISRFIQPNTTSQYFRLHKS